MEKLKKLAEEFVDHPQILTFIWVVRGYCYTKLLCEKDHFEYYVLKAEEISEKWRKEREKGRKIEQIHIRDVMTDEFIGFPESEAWASVMRLFEIEFFLDPEVRKEVAFHISNCRGCRKEVLACILGYLQPRLKSWGDELRATLKEILFVLESKNLTVQN